MPGKKRSTSRRATPWDTRPDDMLTPLQLFIRDHYLENYQEKHPRLDETGESELINTYVPESCPYCGCTRMQRRGLTRNGVQRYLCMNPECGKAFTPLTGTIFDSHRVSISEWVEYVLNLSHYLSINAESRTSKNAYTTSRYWLEKVFIILEHVFDDIVLEGDVWFDETYWTVALEEMAYLADGAKLPGISRNKLCIAVACTKTTCICIATGKGRPTRSEIYEAFKDHIAPGSKLIHDGEGAHKLLIEKLGLQSEVHTTAEAKGLLDKDNPLQRVNRVHALLTAFLESHSGFDRSYLQNMLNLFMFIFNPPSDQLEKVEKIIEMSLKTRKILRYRDFYKNKF